LPGSRRLYEKTPYNAGKQEKTKRAVRTKSPHGSQNSIQQALGFCYIILQLGYFQTQGNALLAVHAKVGILYRQKVFELMLVLFQIHNEVVLLLVVIHLKVNSAGTDVRVKFPDFVAKSFLVVHETLLLQLLAKLKVKTLGPVFNFRPDSAPHTSTRYFCKSPLGLTRNWQTFLVRHMNFEYKRILDFFQAPLHFRCPGCHSARHVALTFKIFSVFLQPDPHPSKKSGIRDMLFCQKRLMAKKIIFSEQRSWPGL
jgi:hypothetical protein